MPSACAVGALLIVAGRSGPGSGSSSGLRPPTPAVDGGPAAPVHSSAIAAQTDRFMQRCAHRQRPSSPQNPSARGCRAANRTSARISSSEHSTGTNERKRAGRCSGPRCQSGPAVAQPAGPSHTPPRYPVALAAPRACSPRRHRRRLNVRTLNTLSETRAAKQSVLIHGCGLADRSR
jgi:hypothetical protein